MATYVGLLDVLGDRTRLSIIEQLGGGPRAVVDLADALPVSRPAISQHLKVLQGAGLVAFEAQGNRNVYHLRPDGIRPLRDWLDQFWGDVLGAFAGYANPGPTRADNGGHR